VVRNTTLRVLLVEARQGQGEGAARRGPAQLSPVAAGGAFRVPLTDQADAPELVDVRRLRHECDRAASLALRDG
jgi:hypothetical protein